MQVVLGVMSRFALRHSCLLRLSNHTKLPAPSHSAMVTEPLPLLQLPVNHPIHFLLCRPLPGPSCGTGAVRGSSTAAAPLPLLNAPRGSSQI
jgi:hypothetical protein